MGRSVLLKSLLSPADLEYLSEGDYLFDPECPPRTSDTPPVPIQERVQDVRSGGNPEPAGSTDLGDAWGSSIDSTPNQLNFGREYQSGLAISPSPVEHIELSGGGTKSEPPCSTRGNSPFYPADDRPRPYLSFARFDNDPELLKSIQDLNVPVLKDAVWRPNSDGWVYGGFGYIERAWWNKQDVAVKFLRSSHTITGTDRGKRSFRKEVIAWRKLAHPNILPFLGVVCVDNTYLGMVSPYMRNGSAPKYIAKHPEADVLKILYDVAAGMSHLASQEPPIAHGDLKGANVLIDPDGRACICDFGLSRFMKDFMSIDTTFGGTIRWMAPEQLRSDVMIVSLSADIFSWGMLALELMTGSIPWSEVQQDSAVTLRVAMRNERPDRPTCQNQRCQAQPMCTCLIGDDALWALIQQCWLDDPKQRPTVAQLCDALAQNPRLRVDRKYEVSISKTCKTRFPLEGLLGASVRELLLSDSGRIRGASGSWKVQPRNPPRVLL